MRIDLVVKYWARSYPFIDNKVEVISQEIQDVLIAMIKSKGKALPGVYSTLEQLNLENRKCGLASSSSIRFINEVVDALHIKHYFKQIHSAEFEKMGKPSPDVFLTTARYLASDPYNCIVYEESKNGMLAGINAKMKVVLIPEFPEEKYDWYQQSHLLLRSLQEFNIHQIEAL